jgi:hypothetical protein
MASSSLNTEVFQTPLKEVDFTCDSFVEAWLEQRKEEDVIMQRKIQEEGKTLADFIDNFNNKDGEENGTTQSFQSYKSDCDEDEDDYDPPECSYGARELDAGEKEHLNFVYTRLAELAEKSAHENKTEALINKATPSWLVKYNTIKSIRAKEAAKNKNL